MIRKTLLAAALALATCSASAANITLMSYRGTCHIGVDTDGGAVPDPDVFIASLRAGFDEVLSLAADPGPT